MCSNRNAVRTGAGSIAMASLPTSTPGLVSSICFPPCSRMQEPAASTFLTHSRSAPYGSEMA